MLFLIEIRSSLGSESVPSNIGSLVFVSRSGHWIGTTALLSLRGYLLSWNAPANVYRALSAKLELQKIPCFGGLEITMDLG